MKEAWREIQKREGRRKLPTGEEVWDLHFALRRWDALRIPRPGVERGFEIVSSVPGVDSHQDISFVGMRTPAKKILIKGLRGS